MYMIKTTVIIDSNDRFDISKHLGVKKHSFINVDYSRKYRCSSSFQFRLKSMENLRFLSLNAF